MASGISSESMGLFRTLENFARGDFLGTGSFCEVIQCTDKLTNRQYAMKIVPKKMSALDQACAMEAHCLRALEASEHIVTLFWEFDASLEWVAILEWCEGGELWALVRNCGCAVEEESTWYTCQMVEAMSVCHRAGIVHRDIKCENFLLTKERRLRLIDFGTARDTSHPEVRPMMLKPSYEHHVGTPNFMAPEAVHGKANNFCSDLWSLGCAVYQLILGVPPFNAPTPFLVMEKVIAGNLWMPTRGMKAEERNFIQQLIQVEPKARLGAKDHARRLLYHPLLNNRPSEPPEPDSLSRVLVQVSRAISDETDAGLAAATASEDACDEQAFAVFGQPPVCKAEPGEALRRLRRDVSELVNAGTPQTELQVLVTAVQRALDQAESSGKPEDFATILADFAENQAAEVPVFARSLLGRYAEMAEQRKREAMEQANFGAGDGGGEDESAEASSAQDSEDDAAAAAAPAAAPAASEGMHEAKSGQHPVAPEGSMAVATSEARGPPSASRTGCCPKRSR
mmetsp:Transcript_44627/g.105821  ORF Transcript_44627/g.105821 Transcript_44627/m.105821 type:complete len:512 (+) Transcript_44627:151-1686(+)